MVLKAVPSVAHWRDAYTLTVSALALLLVASAATAADLRIKPPMNSFKKSYQCRYDGYRKFGSVIRFSSDGDEKRVYFKIDNSWTMDGKQRLFRKSFKTGPLTQDGKQYPERFINAIFDVDEGILTREHGFVGSPVDYISYYECGDIH